MSWDSIEAHEAREEELNELRSDLAALRAFAEEVLYSDCPLRRLPSLIARSSRKHGLLEGSKRTERLTGEKS